MAALSGQGVEVERQSSYQGFALASFHLGNLSLVKNSSPYQLDVKMSLPYGSLGCLSNSGVSLGQNLIQTLAILQSRLKLIGSGPEFSVAEFFKVRLARVYIANQRLNAP
jgi:hypothetical protein